jgi:hypothetical protein
MNTNKYAIAIHGGAGVIPKVIKCYFTSKFLENLEESKKIEYLNALNEVLVIGKLILEVS